MTAPAVTGQQRRLASHGALMLLLGMIYGVYVALVMTEQAPGEPEMALGAHLNALLGSFWLLGMGWSLQFVVLSPRLLRLAVGLTLVGAWSNWILSALKAVSGDLAISFTGAASNDVLFGLRTILVIVPCIVGPAIWVWGLRTPRGESSDSP